jgi:hypothetical protein
MSLRKYRFGDRVNDDLAQAFDDFFAWPFASSYRVNGRLVNTDDYELVPKKHTIERKVKEAEQRLQSLKDQRENEKRFFDERQKQIEDEIYDLKKKLSS